MPTTSRSDSRGFTLIEVLMAMLIMTVGLLGLLQSIQVAYQQNARNRMREEALLVAEEQMGGFRSMEFDSITATRAALPVRREMGGGIREFFVTRDSETVGTGEAKKLTVAVSWSFKQMTTQHVIYTMRTR